MNLFCRVATYYTKVMERVQSKGDAFITTEIDRLGRLLGKTLFAHVYNVKGTHFCLPISQVYDVTFALYKSQL